MKFLTSGKVKDVYELEDGKLLFKFSNRVSAYDVKFKDEIPKKGEVLCKFAQYWFNKLGMPCHFEERRSDTEIVVRKLNMLPIGTQTDLAAKLPSPIFDPTTKSAHDMPVNREEAISQKLVTNDEYDWLSEESIKIYEKMARIADNAGFILADLKLEFGRENNAIILADSIGPDEFRLWPKDAYKIGETQEAYDKQLLRDWLTENGYQKKFDDARSCGEEPIAPSIPSGLVSKMTQRYVTAYERLSGNTL